MPHNSSKATEGYVGDGCTRTRTDDDRGERSVGDQLQRPQRRVHWNGAPQNAALLGGYPIILSSYETRLLTRSCILSCIIM
ncbi:hypothetical protein Pelo_19188 [Pelomyxa schiedti]|nr:hypothetical protein Pelo_19188 [Pelomyxa schiedti]